MPFYKRGVISKIGRETFFFISKIIHLHYNHSYFKGLLLVHFFTVSWVFPHCGHKETWTDIFFYGNNILDRRELTHSSTVDEKRRQC